MVKYIVDDASGYLYPATVVYPIIADEVEEDEEDGMVLNPKPYEVLPKYTDLVMITETTIERGRGNEEKSICRALLNRERDRERVVIKKHSISSLRELWSLIREIRFYRKTPIEFQHFLIPLIDVMIPVTTQYFNSRVEDIYTTYYFHEGFIKFDAAFLEGTKTTLGMFGGQAAPPYKLILSQLLLILVYFRSRRICHRDIVSDNLYITPNLFGLDYKLQVAGLGSYTLQIADSTVNEWVLKDAIPEVLSTRPPECLFDMCYPHVNDIWSVGCLFGKMIRRQDLFRGETAEEVLTGIANILGDPSPADIDFITMEDSEQAIQFMVNVNYRYENGYNHHPGADFHQLFQVLNDVDGIDLLRRMLTFNPSNRIKPEEALDHPYLKEFIENHVVLSALVNQIRENGHDNNEADGASEHEDAVGDLNFARPFLLVEKFLFLNPSLQR